MKSIIALVLIGAVALAFVLLIVSKKEGLVVYRQDNSENTLPTIKPASSKEDIDSELSQIETELSTQNFSELDLSGSDLEL
jgi:hypothetical protein